MAEQRSTDVTALSALILGSALLAFGPMLVRLSDTGPIASAFWRMALAWPVLAAFALFARKRTKSPSLALPLAGAALAGMWFAFDVASWHMGIMRTTTANATLFGNMAAFMLAGWAIIARGERPKPSTIRAMVLAAVGAILLLGNSASLSREHLVGDLLCLLAACFYTAYFIVIIRLRDTQPTSIILALCTLASALLLLPAALIAEPGALFPQDWRPLLVLATTSQLAGQGLLLFASGRLPATLIGLGLLVQPVVAALSGWAAFGEVPGAFDLIGAALILGALVLVRR